MTDLHFKHQHMQGRDCTHTLWWPKLCGNLQVHLHVGVKLQTKFKQRNYSSGVVSWLWNISIERMSKGTPKIYVIIKGQRFMTFWTLSFFSRTTSNENFTREISQMVCFSNGKHLSLKYENLFLVSTLQKK